MTETQRRKKQPEKFRRELLAAAGKLAAEQGVQAVTLEAVASLAGVSKGGLQHHFRSKQQLLDALFAEMMEGFNAEIIAEINEDELEQGRVTRSFLKVAKRSTERGTNIELCKVLMISMLSDPNYGQFFLDRLAGSMEEDKPDSLEEEAKLMICRLAADGMWLSEMTKVHRIPAGLRQEIFRQLMEMTRQKHESE